MVSIFKALAEESRLRILSLVIDREMCVCEIEAILDMTQSNVSRHLTTLKQSGILECQRKAQWAYYRINENFIKDHKELYDYLRKSLKELPTYRMDYMEFERCRDMDICCQSLKPH